MIPKPDDLSVRPNVVFEVIDVTGTVLRQRVEDFGDEELLFKRLTLSAFWSITPTSNRGAGRQWLADCQTSYVS